MNTKQSFGLALCLSLLSSAAWASDPGVSADKIVFGQGAALEGPAAPLGLGMKLGIEAAFKEANAAGGVNGRQLELVSKNDGYEPTKAIEVVRELVEKDKVFSLIGLVGTPTTVAVKPVAAELKTPIFGPFTGAKALRDPVDPNLVNFRASYGQETEAMVEHLTKDLGVKKIGIFYQDDAYGKAGLDGVTNAMKKRSMTLVAEGTYERNTTAVLGAVAALSAAEPEAIIMVGAPKPSAEFIRAAKGAGMTAKFVNISFVGADALAKEVGAEGDGVYVFQVVPLPTDSTIPLVASYQAALKAQDATAKPGFISLEGYIVGKLTIEALKAMDKTEPTREGFVKTLESFADKDIGGMKISLSGTDHQGSDHVYVTRLGADGVYSQVETMAK